MRDHFGARLARDRSGPIRRAVVDDEHVVDRAAKTVEHFTNRCGLVEGRHERDDTERSAHAADPGRVMAESTCAGSDGDVSNAGRTMREATANVTTVTIDTSPI